MKKIIEDNNTEGLEKFLGEKVTLICCRYFYTGVLKGVSDTDVLLGDPGIVYETGPFDEKDWKDMQKIINDSKEWYVSRQAVESFGIMK